MKVQHEAIRYTINNEEEPYALSIVFTKHISVEHLRHVKDYSILCLSDDFNIYLDLIYIFKSDFFGVYLVF